MKGLKSLFGLLMLLVMASFLFTSCDQQKKELKEIVDKMKKRVIHVSNGEIVRDDKKGGYSCEV
jgi:hypothetical protein